MMSVSRTAILVVMAGLLAPGGVVAQSLEDEVKSAYAAWDEAFNQGDAAAVAAFYADDALFLPPTHDVVEGPAGVEDFFAGLFEAGVSGHSLELIEANGNDQMAVGAARWSAKGGDGSDLGGIATHEFVRQDDGNLKLKLHTFN